MTADQVIERVRQWRGVQPFGPHMPGATVLAEHDWLAYVRAMAAAVPAGEKLTFPTEADVAWAWPAGVTLVFAEPQPIEHVIVSKDTALMYDGDMRLQSGAPHGLRIEHERVAAHYEQQTAAGMIVMPLQLMPTRLQDGTPMEPMPAIPVIWIGTNPTDIITGQWLPGHEMQSSAVGVISESSRIMLAVITALGHRLTRVAPPVTANRGERRRVHRELPSLRVLQLSTGASVQRTEHTGTVEWSRRWMVRGHWRLQPYGPRRTLRRAQWIDPYVKGPEDKPLDVRPTVWRAHADQEGQA